MTQLGSNPQKWDDDDSVLHLAVLPTQNCTEYPMLLLINNKPIQNIFLQFQTCIIYYIPYCNKYEPWHDKTNTSSPKGNDRSPESNVPMSNLI